jgi:hypothetical protein
MHTALAGHFARSANAATIMAVRSGLIIERIRRSSDEEPRFHDWILLQTASVPSTVENKN